MRFRALFLCGLFILPACYAKTVFDGLTSNISNAVLFEDRLTGTIAEGWYASSFSLDRATTLTGFTFTVDVRTDSLSGTTIGNVPDSVHWMIYVSSSGNAFGLGEGTGTVANSYVHLGGTFGSWNVTLMNVEVPIGADLSLPAGNFFLALFGPSESTAWAGTDSTLTAGETFFPSAGMVYASDANSFSISGFDSPTPVPEPSNAAVGLSGISLLSFCVIYKRRRRLVLRG